MQIKAALAKATEALDQKGIPTARLDASLLLRHVLGLSREALLRDGDNTMNKNDIMAFEALVARRLQYEPIAYITGQKEFWSLDFCVTRDTLIPRPDSETLIEAALKRVRDRGNNMRERAQGQAKPIALLDIGTGTGCLLIALLKEIPEARGIGLDNSKPALQVASGNAKKHGVDSRAEFIESHWCDAINGKFDLIISNPPYIADAEMGALMPDVLKYEPHTALVAGGDGLDAYRALAPQVATRLNPGGWMLFEVGHAQADAVAVLLEQTGLECEPHARDLAGIARGVIAHKPIH